MRADGPGRVTLGLSLERLHQLAGLLEVLLQAGLAAKGGRTGVGAHAHAVLRHARQADRACCGQGGHVVCEQVVHQGFVAGAKVVECVVVHRDAPANPAVGGTEHNRDTNVTRNILARGLLELEREFATAGEAKADEAAVNKDSGALSSMAGVGLGPRVAGIPFQVA